MYPKNIKTFVQPYLLKNLWYNGTKVSVLLKNLNLITEHISVSFSTEMQELANIKLSPKFPFENTNLIESSDVFDKVPDFDRQVYNLQKRIPYQLIQWSREGSTCSCFQIKFICSLPVSCLKLRQVFQNALERQMFAGKLKVNNDL